MNIFSSFYFFSTESCDFFLNYNYLFEIQIKNTTASIHLTQNYIRGGGGGEVGRPPLPMLRARDKLRMGSLCKGQVEDGVSMQGTS